MKIGMYSNEEILEHLTEGEGRGFLGRSMYDAIIGEIEQLTISLQAQEELTTSWYNKTKQQSKEIERLNNIIKEAREILNMKLAFTSSYQLNYQSAMSIIEEAKSTLRGVDKN